MTQQNRAGVLALQRGVLMGIARFRWVLLRLRPISAWFPTEQQPSANQAADSENPHNLQNPPAYSVFLGFFCPDRVN